MAIEIKETFQVQAPIDVVWRFLMDAHQVAACMPGAELEEVVDDRTFMGNIKVKVGPITTSYKGRIQFTEVDDKAYSIRMVAEGRETSGGGGGMAKGSMLSRLQALSHGETEVTVEAGVEVSGRIMQFGRGMIPDISHQLFQQFVVCAKERLEAQAGALAAAPAAPAQATAAAAATEKEPISILPLVLRAFGSSIGRFFRRLFGRPAT